jgi:hypothetical protein
MQGTGDAPGFGERRESGVVMTARRLRFSQPNEQADTFRRISSGRRVQSGSILLDRASEVVRCEEEVSDRLTLLRPLPQRERSMNRIGGDRSMHCRTLVLD